MAGFTLIPTAVNRGMILAMGRYGTRALSHIWERLWFEDYQRRYLHPELPSIRNLLSTSLILPKNNGRFIAGCPNTEVWDDPIFINKVSRYSSKKWDDLNELEPTKRNTLMGSLLQEANIGTGIVAKEGRSGYFSTIIDSNSIHKLRSHINHVAHCALVDEDAPGSDVNRFNVYIIVSMNDHFATALLWPLVMIIREQLSQYLPLEIIGLINTGAFVAQDELLSERAKIYVSLQELNYFSQANKDLSLLNLSPECEHWVGKKYFDHCYLLDAQKRNGTLARNEKEIIVSTGNILETFLVSNALDLIDEHISPDQNFIRKNGPFGTVGTSSLYIPLYEWRNRNVKQFNLEILEQKYLNSKWAEDTRLAENVRNTTKRFTSQYLDYSILTRRIVERCPFQVDGGWGGGVLEELLNQTGQSKSLLENEGPIQPVPEINVDPKITQVGVGRDVAPEDWLKKLYLHFRLLGMPPLQIFPGDPQIDEFEADWPKETSPRTYRREWYDKILIACDSHNASHLMDEDAYPFSIPSYKAQGVVPNFSQRLCREISVFLRQSNQGILMAEVFLDRIDFQLCKKIDQLVEYRTRLDRALTSVREVRNREETAKKVLSFRKLLQNRPHLPGLIGRLTMMAAISSIIVFYELSFELLFSNISQQPVVLWVQQRAAQLWPWFALIVGLGGGFVIGIFILWVYRKKLKRVFHSIEDDLTRKFNLQINRELIGLFYEDNLGLLNELYDVLNTQRVVINRALLKIRNKVSDLKEDLSDPISARQTFIRQSLPGLETLRKELVQETRPDLEDFSPTLLTSDSKGAQRWLDDMLKHDMENVMLKNHILDTTKDKIAERYSEATERYDSLGDLILSVVERLGQQVDNIVPPADLHITNLLADKLPSFTILSFLADLKRKAQVLLNWDPECLDRRMPISLDLISLEQGQWSSLKDSANERKLKIAPSFDPFSITIIRFRYGFIHSAVPRFRAYKEAFHQLDIIEKEKLTLEKETLNMDESYLSIDKEENI